MLALALGQQALAPRVGGEGRRAAPPLSEQIRTEALPLLADADYRGLGAESRRLLSWTTAHAREARPGLTLDERTLRDAAGHAFQLSPEMARALRHLDLWYGLTPATLARPITHEDLRAAALAPASVARIARLFEEAIRRGVRLDGAWHIPETGGEAALDTELRLHAMPDPTWPTVQTLARLGTDPQGLAALCRQRPVEMELLDPHKLLRLAIARLPLGLPGALESVRRAAATIVENAAHAYSLGPEAQFELIVSSDWRGRYVGRWHTHAPRHAPDGWRNSEMPSYEDMHNALEAGQFLTLSFQADGFDLHDAAPLAEAGRIDLSLLEVIRYRSPAWREHFAGLHALLERQ